MSKDLECTVEILSIGNELLLGNTFNTNATWIAERVTALGGKVRRITTVADNLNEISQAVSESIKRRPRILITTGGIGPTFDDMTLSGVAKALGLRLKLDNVAVAMIRQHYARRFPRRRISLTKPRLKMALIPSGGTPILNPVGTAPSVRINVNQIAIFCLPGVPREAKAIFTRTLAEIIRARARGRKFLEKWIEVRGIMESSLAPVLDALMRRSTGVYIKSHPRGIEAGGHPFIHLHFSMSSSNERKAERVLDQAVCEAIEGLSRLGGRVRQIE